MRVLPVHPNLSDWDAKMEGPGTVRMGFRNIIKIRQEDVGNLVRERETRSFSDVLDFIQRTRFPRVVIENMALANLFECFGLMRRDTFWSSIDFQSLYDRQQMEQMPLFGETKSKVPTPKVTFKKMSLFEEILADHEALTYSLHGNIMKAVRLEKIPLPMTTSEVLKKLQKDRVVTVVGLVIVIQRPPTARGNCFLTLEDEFGTMDITVKAELFESCKQTIANHRFLQITAKVQVSGTFRSLLAIKVEKLRGIDLDGMKPNEPGEHPRSLSGLSEEYQITGSQ